MEYHIKKDLNYYTKKINNYITLINSGEELSDKEKEIIEKKLIKLVSKLELIKKSEELNIENINNKTNVVINDIPIPFAIFFIILFSLICVFSIIFPPMFFIKLY